MVLHRIQRQLHSELTHSCDDLIEELNAWVYTTEKVLRLRPKGMLFSPANDKSVAVSTASKLAAIRYCTRLSCTHDARPHYS